MDNNYVKLDISDYNQLIDKAYRVEQYKAEILKLKEEQLKLEEEIFILKSKVDDGLEPEEECMTDPSQECCLDGFKIAENDWKELLAYLKIQQKDINLLCSILTYLVSEKDKETIENIHAKYSFNE